MALILNQIFIFINSTTIFISLFINNGRNKYLLNIYIFMYNIAWLYPFNPNTYKK